MTSAAPVKKIYRSSEEGTMRDLIVPRLRARWPGARIIHELPLRYSTNRIDLAAVTPREIVSVEIKSSRDVVDRLEAQLRAFLPIRGSLNPTWVEWLMGFPLGWTVCEAWATRLSRKSRKSSGGQS